MPADKKSSEKPLSFPAHMCYNKNNRGTPRAKRPITAEQIGVCRNNAVIASQCSHWRGNPPVRGEMYRQFPYRTGKHSDFGGNRYLVPFIRGIATTSLRTGLAMTGNPGISRQTPICQPVCPGQDNCQLSIVNSPFADRALSELRAGGEEVTPAGQGGEAPGAQVLRLEQALGGAVVAAAAAGGNPGDLILENPVVDPAGNDF